MFLSLRMSQGEAARELFPGNLPKQSDCADRLEEVLKLGPFTVVQAHKEGYLLLIVPPEMEEPGAIWPQGSKAFALIMNSLQRFLTHLKEERLLDGGRNWYSAFWSRHNEDAEIRPSTITNCNALINKIKATGGVKCKCTYQTGDHGNFQVMPNGTRIKILCNTRGISANDPGAFVHFPKDRKVRAWGVCVCVCHSSGPTLV